MEILTPSAGRLEKVSLGDTSIEMKVSPLSGLYFDIDYWITPKSEVGEKDLLKKVEEFAYSAWDRFDNISKLILGG